MYLVDVAGANGKAHEGKYLDEVREKGRGEREGEEILVERG